AQNPQEDFSGGDGSSASPYQITSFDELSNIRNYIGVENADLHFKIMDDIDLSGEQWQPIAGVSGTAFHGKLNGSGKFLFGLNIGRDNNPTVAYAGLFGILKDGAVIDSVNLVGGYIRVNETGSGYAGSIAAYIDERTAISEEPTEVTISNCYSSVSIEALGGNNCDIGGIIGRCHNIAIEPVRIITNFINCRYEGNISAAGTSNIGGLLGNNSSFDGATVEMNFINCSNTANISSLGANSNVGGLYGNTFSEGPVTLVFSGCYNTGYIKGGTNESYTGGIIGYCRIFSNAELSIQDCYSNSEIECQSHCVGGLVGNILSGSDITTIINIKNCYAAGTISGYADFAGGIVSKVEPTTANYKIENCIAAQTSINCKLANSEINRIVGIDYAEIDFVNNYANATMTLNGNVLSSSDANSIFGKDKSYRDLLSVVTYTTSNFNWNITAGENTSWNIVETKSLPYFYRQSAPANIVEAYRDSIKFELVNQSDKLILNSVRNDYIAEFEELNAGLSTKSVNLSDMHVGEYISVVNSESNKESSYPVLAQLQKRNIVVHADNLQKCFGENDPEFTYTTTPQLMIGDVLNGSLTRQIGENAGSYNILQGTLDSENYNIFYSRGTLTIHKINTSILQEGNLISAITDNATYQWLDCSNNFAPIENMNEQIFAPSQSGRYAVEISQNECVDTSECVDVTIIGIENIESKDVLVSIFPNPINTDFYVNFNQRFDNIRTEIFSADGKKIDTKFFKNENSLQLKLNETSGIYYIKIYLNEAYVATYKIVKIEN
ncbi:T9SS type A sorting domain-containing protein, partial [Bacteroidales bacterium OttesenSCG-928-I21]|nr:T9SS type A sorting domain-containing protein [Bacteroidales bacterium OttesenSCG-928-I21]